MATSLCRPDSHTTWMPSTSRGHESDRDEERNQTGACDQTAPCTSARTEEAGLCASACRGRGAHHLRAGSSQDPTSLSVKKSFPLKKVVSCLSFLFVFVINVLPEAGWHRLPVCRQERPRTGGELLAPPHTHQATPGCLPGDRARFHNYCSINFSKFHLVLFQICSSRF